jgi:RimJ/RimL family protein N-acetyltransferase
VLTARLAIRPATGADAEATWRYRRLEAVGRWLTSAPADQQEYQRSFRDPARLAKTLLIQLRDAGTAGTAGTAGAAGPVIGDAMVAVEDGWAQSEVADRARGVQAEIGWALDPAHQGVGYATEAVGELLRICFDGLGLRRVTAGCFADNAPSWRLMERVGMRREEYSVADSLHRSGAWLDGMAYALLAEEWRARPGTSPAAEG